MSLGENKVCEKAMTCVISAPADVVTSGDDKPLSCIRLTIEQDMFLIISLVSVISNRRIKWSFISSLPNMRTIHTDHFRNTNCFLQTRIRQAEGCDEWTITAFKCICMKIFYQNNLKHATTGLGLLFIYILICFAAFLYPDIWHRHMINGTVHQTRVGTRSIATHRIAQCLMGGQWGMVTVQNSIWLESQFHGCQLSSYINTMGFLTSKTKWTIH